ncbi:hypothetical protein LUZ60_000354 [Juncus effusus]|nr:hypothetical protein LUZ60_000354 [Juncus effusus]
MWEAICMTLAATAGNNIGKVLQKKGTLILPPLSFKLKVIKAYVFNKLWISGFAMDMSGAFLMLMAISQAPVSVIQPVAGCGLAILSVFSHFYLKEVLNALDWVGITLAGIGTIGVGVGGEEQNITEISLIKIPWLILSITLLFVLLNAWLHMYKRQRREQEQLNSEVTEEIILGLESGILFGISSVISKMGFVLSDKSFLMIPICISLSVLCSAAGFIYQTQGLKHGRAIVVSTCTSVASILTGVIVGMIALGEKMPSNSVSRLVLITGWFFIILGVIMLVSSSKIISLLPKPLRKKLRKNTEMNLNIRRSGSLRVKDGTSPSSTIVNILSPATKEKSQY